jgi:PAS domain S-box-containing protein
MKSASKSRKPDAENPRKKNMDTGFEEQFILTHAFEKIRTPILILDKQLRVFFINSAAQKLFGGYSEIINKKYSKILKDKKSAEKVAAAVKKLLQKGRKYKKEELLYRIGESEFSFFETNISLLYYEEKKRNFFVLLEIFPFSLLSIFPEKAIYYDDLLDLFPVGVVFSDRFGNILDCNRAAYKMLGFSRKKDFISHNGQEFIEKERLKELQSEVNKFLEEGKVFSTEIGLVKNNRKVFRANLVVRPIKDEEGEITGFLNVFVDVQRLYDAENKWRALAEKHEYILTEIPGIAVQTYDINARVKFWNKASEELFGYREEEALGKEKFELLYPKGKSKEEARKRFRKFFSKKSIKPEVIELVSGDKILKVLVFRHVLKNEFGEKELFCFCVDLTEKENLRKELEIYRNKLEKLVEQKSRELRESEEKFRALTENSRDVIMRFDRQYRHLYVNPMIKEQTGISPEEMIGKTHKELGFPKNLTATFEKAIARVFKTGKEHRIKFELPNGIWIDWLLFPEFDEKGKVKYVITSARDITEIIAYEKNIKELNRTLERKVKAQTKELKKQNQKLLREIEERKKAEKKLRESESLYKSFLNGTSDGVLISDIEGYITYYNESALKLLRYKEGELLGKHVFHLVAKDEIPHVRDIYFQSKEEGKSFREELLLRRKDDTTFFADISADFIKDDNGRPVLVTLFAKDITEKKEKEKRFRELFEFSASGIIETDLEGNILEVNRRYCEISGYTREELLKMNISQIAYPGSEYEVKRNLEILKSGKALHHTVKNLTKDGRTVYLELFEKMVGMENEDKRILTTIIDITEKIESGQKLFTKEAIFNTLFKNSPSGIIIEDENGYILDVNDALAKTLGYERTELVGKHISILAAGKEQKNVKDNIDTILRGYPLLHRAESRCKDGSVKVMDLSEIRVPLGGGKFGILVLSKDVTEEVKKEKKLVKEKEEAEKLVKAKQEFVRQFSHEVRSPLSVVMTYIDFLAEDLGEEIFYAHKKEFEIIKSSARRILKTTEAFLDESVIDAGLYKPEWEIVDLETDEFIGKVFDEYKLFAELKGLKFECVNTARNGKIYTDKYSLSLVISNLLDNAIKYTKEGSVVLRAFNEDDKVVVQVEDTGKGMSADFRKKLFKEFNREEGKVGTKEGGLGLGLSLVKKYLKFTGGKISVKTVEGKGTLFTLTFPIAEEKK